MPELQKVLKKPAKDPPEVTNQEHTLVFHHDARPIRLLPDRQCLLGYQQAAF